MLYNIRKSLLLKPDYPFHMKDLLCFFMDTDRNLLVGNWIRYGRFTNYSYEKESDAYNYR